MKAVMPRYRPTIIFSVTALLIAAAPAWPIEIVTPTYRGATIGQGSGDLRALENRLQRQQFQQLQQQNRQQERLSIPLQRQKPEVPTVKPGCQTQVYGNGVVGGCR